MVGGSGSIVALWILLAALAVASPAAAESAWDSVLEGVEQPVFRGSRDVGVMIVTPQADEATVTLEVALRDRLIASGLAALVMDDTPLGAIAAASDQDLLAATRAYPVDVVLLLRTFPAASGEVVAVLRVDVVGDGTSESFRFRPGAPPPWAQESNAEPVASTSAPTTEVPEAAEAAPAVDPVGQEPPRRRLEYEPDRRSPVVRNKDGDVVPWPRAYAEMGREELGQRFQRRRTARTATVVAGAGLMTAGVGLLFVGLANQTNCAGSQSGCGRPTLAIAGVTSTGVGLIAVLTGMFLRPHPIPATEIEDLVRQHNEGPAD